MCDPVLTMYNDGNHLAWQGDTFQHILHIEETSFWGYHLDQISQEWSSCEHSA